MKGVTLSAGSGEDFSGAWLGSFFLLPKPISAELSVGANKRNAKRRLKRWIAWVIRSETGYDTRNANFEKRKGGS